LKILLVSPEYPPRSIGGGGAVYKNLSGQLASKGHSVNVIAGNFDNKNPLGKIEVSEDNGHLSFIPLLPHPNLKKANSASYTPPTLRGILFIVKALVRNKNNIVHLHGFCHPIIEVTAFTCIVFRKKYVITCHGIPINPQTFSLPAKIFFNLYLSIIERLIVKNAVALTTVSGSLKNECISRNLINKKMVVIPNGTDSSLANPQANIVIAIEEKYSLQGRPVIFALGRLSENKGFHFLIKAMHTVIASVPNAVAVIAGSGPYKTQLEELIQSEGLSGNVKLVGWVSENVKAALYELSEVVVFPSINEPFGMVMLEALKLHKPLISFNTDSAREVLSPESAMLVAVGDASALGNAIVQVLTDSELKSKLVANASKANVSSWDKVANQYLDVYQVINEPFSQKALQQSISLGD
jgi:glycosyltransferase involved in cell wall biosynthesis